MDNSCIPSKIWYIHNQLVGGDLLRGGGICIDPTGLIVTVAHLVTHDTLKCCIKARAFDDTSLTVRTVELLHSLPKFDLAILRVTNEVTTPFPFLDLGEAVRIGPLESVFCHVPYAQMSGYVNYDFPNGVELPDVSSEDTVISRGLLDDEERMFRSPRFRTVGSIVSEGRELLYDMHPDLPLIQVHRFEVEADMFGYPLFKSENGEFVGLFFFLLSEFYFVIPLNFIKRFVDHVRHLYNL